MNSKRYLFINILCTLYDDVETLEINELDL